LLIVVSAMGKMTNALEVVVNDYFETGNYKTALRNVYDFHDRILKDLFPAPDHPVFSEVQELFEEVHLFLTTNKSGNHAFVYDQVVSLGELVSSKIVRRYFVENGLPAAWLDVRKCIKTDSSYRDASVNWELTEKRILQYVDPEKITVTQGFLGAEDTNNFTTTLGREGSDYTAAIFAYCLNAAGVTIWKDVPGVLNADPRYFSKTQLLRKISYKEAIELAFYG